MFLCFFIFFLIFISHFDFFPLRFPEKFSGLIRYQYIVNSSLDLICVTIYCENRKNKTSQQWFTAHTPYWLVELIWEMGEVAFIFKKWFINIFLGNLIYFYVAVHFNQVFSFLLLTFGGTSSVYRNVCSKKTIEKRWVTTMKKIIPIHIIQYLSVTVRNGNRSKFAWCCSQSSRC